MAKNECNTPRIQARLLHRPVLLLYLARAAAPAAQLFQNNGTALCVLEYLLQYLNCNICGEYLPLS